MVSPLGPGMPDRILNAIRKNRADAQKSITRIASGKRIAGDNAAANSIATRMQSEIRALSQAVRNAGNGSNFIQAAEGGLSTISELVSRGRQLSIQAANGTLGASEREALNLELNSITSEIDRIAASSEFNGQKLLNGNLAPGSANRIDIQVGSTSGGESQINLNVIEDTSAQALGLDNLDISTPDGALQALDRFEQAGATVNAIRGQLGATTNRLESVTNGLGTTIENLVRSESNLTGTDIIAEITSLQQNLTQIQTSIKILAIQNRTNQQTIGRLLDTQG